VAVEVEAEGAVGEAAEAQALGTRAEDEGRADRAEVARSAEADKAGRGVVRAWADRAARVEGGSMDKARAGARVASQRSEG